MTSDEFPHTLIGRVVELAKVVSAVAILMSAAWSAWAATFGPIASFVQTWEQLQNDVAELRLKMLEVTGEDRVIRETPGLTYVSEPVKVGDTVQFSFVAQRTRLGERCVLKNSTPMYTDERNIPTPGPMRQASRQIDGNPTPLAPHYKMPEGLRPGRVVMHLILEYYCDGKTVFDRTSSVPFLLLPKP